MENTGKSCKHHCFNIVNFVSTNSKSTSLNILFKIRMHGTGILKSVRYTGWLKLEKVIDPEN